MHIYPKGRLRPKFSSSSISIVNKVRITTFGVLPELVFSSQHMNHQLLWMAEREGNSTGMDLVEDKVEEDWHDEPNPTKGQNCPKIELGSILFLPKSTIAIHQSVGSEARTSMLEIKISKYLHQVLTRCSEWTLEPYKWFVWPELEHESGPSSLGPCPCLCPSHSPSDGSWSIIASVF